MRSCKETEGGDGSRVGVADSAVRIAMRGGGNGSGNGVGLA